MSINRFEWILALLLSAGAAYSQINETENFLNKDLIFPHVVAGVGYQTSLTVVNRGAESWQGTLNFYTGKGKAWNPYVNDAQISNGILSTAIPAKATRTYNVTLPGSVEGGFLIARTSNPVLNSSLQGYLSYHLRDGEQIVDSIGVLPSNSFYAATIPFEDFDTICFALANVGMNGASAAVTFRLYSDANESRGTYVLPLSDKEHAAMYLGQMFEEVAFKRGRIEIESNTPVSGMALIQVASGQYSSIPMNSTYRRYHITLGGLSEFDIKELTLWTEGLFVNGYMTVGPPFVKSGSVNSGPDALFAVAGRIENGKMHLHFDGNSSYTYGYDICGYLVSDGGFGLSSTSWNGLFYGILLVKEEVAMLPFSATLVP
jgi:hypothetical protein